MIKVYFQSIAGSHSELVAVFPSEEIYMACLPALRWQADKQRCFVTETVEDIKPEHDSLIDAYDELKLNLNIVDDQESIKAYQTQLDHLHKIIDLLRELEK